MAERKTYHKICVTCGGRFDTKASNRIFCDACKEEQCWFSCTDCGKRTRKSRPHAPTQYCPECVAKRRRMSRPKINATETRRTKKNKGMSINEIIQFGKTHGMSYGEVVAKYGF